jgi:hypothetical protein
VILDRTFAQSQFSDAIGTVQGITLSGSKTVEAKHGTIPYASVMSDMSLLDTILQHILGSDLALTA